MAGTGLMEFASGLTVAAKLLKTLKDLVTAPDAKAQVSELYDVIISSQASAFEMLAKERAMLEEISQLKEKLASVQTWEAEKLRYKLVSPYPGMTVFALQRSMSGGEPAHYLCANCYQRGERRFLQLASNKEGWTYFSCAECDASAPTGYRGKPAAKYSEDISPPQ